MSKGVEWAFELPIRLGSRGKLEIDGPLATVGRWRGLTGDLSTMLGWIRQISRVSITLNVFALALFAAPASHAQLAVDEIFIVGGIRYHLGGGPEWLFLIRVTGANLTSGSVVPPAGPPVTLLNAFGSGLVLQFQDRSFSTFSALQAVYPSGDYAFTLERNETVTLPWNPTEPTGASGQPTLVIDDPAEGAMNVSSMPDVAYTSDCTNCKDLEVTIKDSATGGMAASIGFRELGVVGGRLYQPDTFQLDEQ